MMSWPRSTLLALLIGAIWCAGCKVDRHINPSFSISVKEAKADLRRMAKDPKPLQRPVVIYGGFLDLGPAVKYFERRIKKYTGDDRVSTSTFVFAPDFEDARDSAMQNTIKAFPHPDNPDQAVEVDVVGISMGGLVARYTAIPNETGTRLKIRQLFAIATPHRGAKLAKKGGPGPLVPHMRHGSDFLKRLDAALPQADYSMYSYVRLNDAVVGAANASPEGSPPWWVDKEPFQSGHISAHHDPRIMADIMRRLRGEKPHSTQPAAPLPVQAIDKQKK